MDFNIQLIELKDNYNICYNILSCINRLKVKLQSIDTRFLTRNLDTYLFNKVDNQYTKSLLSVARISRFNSLNRIDKWYTFFKKSIRDLLEKFFNLLKIIRYIIYNMKEQKDPIDFSLVIIINIKNTGITAIRLI